MRSTPKERSEFIARLARADVPAEISRLVMRHAATIHRLAEASCNGVQWYDPRGPRHKLDGTAYACGDTVDTDARKPARLWANVTCPDCKSTRAEARIVALLKPYGIEAKFQGDPRGAVAKLRVPGDRGNDWGGEGLVCVP